MVIEGRGGLCYRWRAHRVLYVYAKIYARIKGYPFRNGIDCGKTYTPFGIHANLLYGFPHFCPYPI